MRALGASARPAPPALRLGCEAARPPAVSWRSSGGRSAAPARTHTLPPSPRPARAPPSPTHPPRHLHSPAEGRYLFINALANHLRFPNAHTHYFSCATLALFTEVRRGCACATGQLPGRGPCHALMWGWACLPAAWAQGRSQHPALPSSPSPALAPPTPTPQAGSELIQEQITRVLLERLIVNRCVWQGT